MVDGLHTTASAEVWQKLVLILYILSCLSLAWACLEQKLGAIVGNDGSKASPQTDVAVLVGFRWGWRR